MDDTAPTARATHLVRAVVVAPLTARAWRELAYCLLGFPIAVLGFVAVIVLLGVGTALTASLIAAVLGLLLISVALAAARAMSAAHRSLARWLLAEQIVPPTPLGHRTGTGLFGRLDARLRDGIQWRSVAYVLVKLPMAAVGVYSVAWWGSGLLNLTAPVRWVLGGRQTSASGEGVQVLSPLPFGSGHVTSLPGTLIAVALGVATLWVAPWFIRAVVAADHWLMRSLLGPGEMDERVRALEVSRALAVDDTAALLRRLERDLHDGAQVRLVALAMSLDMAKQRLGEEGEPVTDASGLRSLVHTAHQNATEAIAELRDLARGIHPPTLDEGLEPALETLAARSTVPVELTADVPERPTPAIETITYFCAAELLTNVIKHSDAHRATITVTTRDGGLTLSVTDDGTGGATPDGDSGLAGLMQRVRTVDGEMQISSPEAGPTSIMVTLPLHA